MADKDYADAIEKWRKEMDTNLRRENGWLALAGLFWLRKGENTIGSDSDCDIRLPARASKRLGVFEFDGNNVTLNVESDLPVEVNGMATKTALLDADQEDVPSFITFNEMRMVVVRRSKGLEFGCGIIRGRNASPSRPANGSRSKRNCASLQPISATTYPASSRCPTSSAPSWTSAWRATSPSS